MMNKYLLLLLVLPGLSACTSIKEVKRNSGWVSLFDGKSLDGWKASEHPGTFTVVNGSIKVSGARSHLFYSGHVMDHDFKNFEFEAEVMTTQGSNSGIYFHTMFQEVGFPVKGYEVQVNNSHIDWRRTGGLYAIKDVRFSPASDNKWFRIRIVVKGKMIETQVNEKVMVSYTEPDNVVRKQGFEQRLVSDGTFALQGHDPKSVVYFKNIRVRPLPDDEK